MGENEIREFDGDGFLNEFNLLMKKIKLLKTGSVDGNQYSELSDKLQILKDRYSEHKEYFSDENQAKIEEWFSKMDEALMPSSGNN